MKNYNKKGRILIFTGIWVNSIAIALALVEGIPEPLPAFSVPLMIVGVMFIVSSNFFKVRKKK